MPEQANYLYNPNHSVSHILGNLLSSCKQWCQLTSNDYVKLPKLPIGCIFFPNLTMMHFPGETLYTPDRHVKLRFPFLVAATRQEILNIARWI